MPTSASTSSHRYRIGIDCKKKISTTEGPRLNLCLNFFFKIATFSCRHRYTGNWICAVPCDGHDDLCADFEDEKCDLGTSLIFIVLLVCGLLLLIIASGESFSHFNKSKNADSEEKETTMDLKIIKIMIIAKKKLLNQHFSKVILQFLV
jgi:hypothetical protein